MEIWKSIPGYEKHYEASTMGRVRSVDRFTGHPRNKEMPFLRRGHILRSELDKSGYPVVTLCVHGKTRTFKVHRLVALAFIPNPQNLPQIDHINGKRYDNRPENLRWCTAKENSNWRDEKNSKKVLCKETGKVFESSYQAAYWLISENIPARNKPLSTNYKNVARNIREACKGKHSYSHTFHWTYIEGSTTISDESKGESSEMANPTKGR